MSSYRTATSAQLSTNCFQLQHTFMQIKCQLWDSLSFLGSGESGAD